MKINYKKGDGKKYWKRKGDEGFNIGDANFAV